MTISRTILAVLMLALPMLLSSAEARSVTASQLSAAGHGRRPTITNRPSRQVYHRGQDRWPHRVRRAHRPGL